MFEASFEENIDDYLNSLEIVYANPDDKKFEYFRKNKVISVLSRK